MAITKDQLDYSPWPKPIWKVLLVGLWSLLPALIGIVGMLLVLLTSPRRTSITWLSGAFHVVCNGWLGKYMFDRGWGGFTLGWSTFYWTTEEDRAITWVHERYHVGQVLRLGLLYWPLYLYKNFKDGYNKNSLEDDAYEFSLAWIVKKKLYQE